MSTIVRVAEKFEGGQGYIPEELELSGKRFDFRETGCYLCDRIGNPADSGRYVCIECWDFDGTSYELWNGDGIVTPDELKDASGKLIFHPLDGAPAVEEVIAVRMRFLDGTFCYPTGRIESQKGSVKSKAA